MTPLKAALVLLTFVAVSGCGGSSEPSGAPGGGSAAAKRETPAAADQAVVESCAGFTVETAAELLGVPAGDLEVQTGPSEEFGGHVCRYWSKDSLIGPGLQFLLDVEPSAAEATATLRRLREEAPAGDAAIRSAAGKPRGGRSVMAFEGIADEALWDPLTGGVTLRAGAIVATVQASASAGRRRTRIPRRWSSNGASPSGLRADWRPERRGSTAPVRHAFGPVSPPAAWMRATGWPSPSSAP